MSNQPFRPVRGIGLAASVLIGLEAVLSIADAISSQYTANVVREYREGAGTEADLAAADAFTLAVAVPSVLVPIAAGVTFIVWIYRSRLNAERVSYPADHRHKRGWTIGSWFTPILNFWYPVQIVQDVWRAFSPEQRDRPLQARDTSGFITGWWVVFLFMSWGDRLVARLVLRDGDFDAIAAATWVTTIITLGAAAMAVLLVKRLNDLQEKTQPVPFSGPVQVHVPGA